MRGHAPNITQRVEDILVFVKGHFPAMKPQGIREHILGHLNAFNLLEEQVPSVRSIQAKLNKPENRERIERMMADPLNRLWSVGLGREYGISPSIVPMLLQITRTEMSGGPGELTYDLTVRKAQWVDYLYPALSEIIKRGRPKLNSAQRAWVLYCVAEQYAKLEELEGMSNEQSASDTPALDTSDLDYRFLIEEDVSNKSIGDASAYVRMPEIMSYVRSLLDSNRLLTIKEHPLTREELGERYRDTPQSEIDRLNRQLRKAAEKAGPDAV